jgi:hypothetical protein
MKFLYDPKQKKVVDVAEVLKKLTPGHKAEIKQEVNQRMARAGYGIALMDSSDEDDSSEEEDVEDDGSEDE